MFLFKNIVLFNIIEREYCIEHISKATGRVATADWIVVKTDNNVSSKPRFVVLIK